VKYIPSLLLLATSAFLLAAPAEAARLESWRFDSGQNQLQFTTDEDVQPQAQLVFDPVRVVIDLPGIVLGRPVANQPMDGAIRSIRVGQFDRNTTRMVVELAPGYTIDPKQIRFRGMTGRQWSVQIPTPQAIANAGSSPTPTAPPSGYVVPTTPTGTSPNLVIGSAVQPTAPTTPTPSAIATIRSVELSNGGSQLVVRADQPITYRTSWDRASGAYRLTINSARFASGLNPQLSAGGPILKLQLRQEDYRTAVVLLQPAANTKIGEVNQPSQQMLALQLAQTQVQAPPGAIPVTPTPLPPRPTQTTPSLPTVPRGRLVVVVDPGHGGPDPGAVGIGGIQEKEIVLDISRQVAQILEQQGIQAVLTRSNDIDLDLQPRVDIAERANAALFVSIHANAIDMSRPDINGLETYYYETGAQLARTIHQNMLQGTGMKDRGVRQARFYVIRNTSMPSVLVEVGFVTGREDAARLSNPASRRQLATAIAQGVLQYIQRSSLGR